MCKLNQYTLKQPTGQRRNHEGNQNIWTNFNENTDYQNFSDSSEKTVLRGKVIAVNAYIKKERSQKQRANITAYGTRKSNKPKPRLAEGRK